MQNLSSADVRESFLGFFESKGHLIVPSASLLPASDPTLLFTNAGMNQFKDAFLSMSAPPAARVADAQKCMRVSGKHNDLEDVGPSPFHHTFFEMLGNWSFGDYYKREAIAWAWELLTKEWGLCRERLYATVFRDEKGEIPTDDEAVGFWKSETEIEHAQILHFGRKDNFWEMGELGPCGPSSEIHFDRGPAFCSRAHLPDHNCQVNGDCERFVEIWNLVFIQYNSLGNGKLEELPAKHVDTGAGFERLVMVMQEKKSTYDTDLFAGVLSRIQELAHQTALERNEQIVAYRVIADHCRAAAFLIGDGVFLGNIGRGYVLRMIIRRAARFGRKLGFREPFLASVAETVIDEMGSHYRELRDRREHILKTIMQEEERFLRTLDQGLVRLDSILSHLTGRNRVLAGTSIFELYATYGLPLEITRDVAVERGFSVDDAGFHHSLGLHRDQSSGGSVDVYGAESAPYASLLEQLISEGRIEVTGVKYDPYSATQVHTNVVGIVCDGARVRFAEKGDKVELVLPSTPFYVEGGGQVSDQGFLVADYLDADRQADVTEPGWRAHVFAMKQPVPGLVLHIVELLDGRLHEGDRVIAQVEADRRNDIKRNHTSTHLLHHALRQILGTHVQQAGSLVAPERLRFDYTHSTAPTRDDLVLVSESVNLAIMENHRLATSHEPYASALESGVIALFGEKYGDTVRVVRIGNPASPVSQELCGGTHVLSTGEIGQFAIVTESSIGAGLRRIEAVTGRHALNFVAERMGVLQASADRLDVRPEDVAARIAGLLDEALAEQKEIIRLRYELAKRDFERLITQARVVDGCAVLAARVDTTRIETVREMTDWFRDLNPSSVVVLGTVLNGRPHIVAAVTQDLADRGVRADALIRRLAPIIGGGGGGTPTLAQAGGRHVHNLDFALESVLDIIVGDAVH